MAIISINVPDEKMPISLESFTDLKKQLNPTDNTSADTAFMQKCLADRFNEVVNSYIHKKAVAEAEANISKEVIAS